MNAATRGLAAVDSARVVVVAVAAALTNSQTRILRERSRQADRTIDRTCVRSDRPRRAVPACEQSGIGRVGTRRAIGTHRTGYVSTRATADACRRAGLRSTASRAGQARGGVGARCVGPRGAQAAARSSAGRVRTRSTTRARSRGRRRRRTCSARITNGRRGSRSKGSGRAVLATRRCGSRRKRSGRAGRARGRAAGRVVVAG